MPAKLTQLPKPGEKKVCYQGDTILFTLETSQQEMNAGAWLRTNLLSATTRRNECITAVEENRTIQNHDWQDLPMIPSGKGRYSLRLGLDEVGTFEAKAFLLPANATNLIWPQGENSSIKVEPADYCAANSVYTAFVRQFKEGKDAAENHDNSIGDLDKAGYTVIPPSGTFRNLIKRLPFIMEEMGFRIIQLLPIHPTPTTYARMGRFGSPFAAMDLKGIDPALAEFDRRTTPLDQFCELVDAVHAHRGKIWLDLPLNHTGWASRMQVRRPDWFLRKEDSAFASPGAWGVVWEDLSELDYSKRDLWQYIAGVILYWCRLGVDGFRCDAGYMIPGPVWRYITSRVRRDYPESLFLLEGLGGEWSLVEELVCTEGLNWAYSELFQNYSRGDIERCINFSHRFSKESGTLIHFCETHDNNRLAAESRHYSQLRTALCALLSDSGAFGVTNGVEWFATEKIDVHGNSDITWGAEFNQVEAIKRLCGIINRHPCFGPEAEIEFIEHTEPNLIAVLRHGISGEELLILINLSVDSDIATEITLPGKIKPGDEIISIFPGETSPADWHDNALALSLPPAGVFCMQIGNAGTPRSGPPAGEPCRIIKQRARLICVSIWNMEQKRKKQNPHISAEKLEKWRESLIADPINFLQRRLSSDGFAHITPIELPCDLRRRVPVPSDHFIVVYSDNPFRIDLSSKSHRRLISPASLPCAEEKRHIAIISPSLKPPESARACSYPVTLFSADGARRMTGKFLDLPDIASVPRMTLTPAEMTLAEHIILTGNTGSMSQLRAAWGEVQSQYDAFLAVNCDPSVPTDRHILINRWRGWIVRHGYSREIGPRDLQSVQLIRSSNSVKWFFRLPTGQGESVPLTIEHTLCKDENRCILSICRLPASGDDGIMPDSSPIRIILRPDIDSRISHSTTKAFTGPEKQWVTAVRVSGNGFDFSPPQLPGLTAKSNKGTFTSETEWTYNIPLPFEKQRGFEGATDYFSPGYFSARLESEGNLTIDSALITDTRHDPMPVNEAIDTDRSIQTILKSAISDFIVRRDSSLTVIAGYPWFLDWGRDTLIALRGITAAGYKEEALGILLEFAKFEEKGTLPNMIRGDDASDRDTSDAPLWFIIAAYEIVLLTERDPGSIFAGGRSLSDIIFSICENYISGTPNGIKADPESGLIFSPAHFTWMDTNYPAGTPREGYPVEIQALWYRALLIAADIDGTPRYHKKAQSVRQNIKRFFSEDAEYCSDCLHCTAGTPAAKAVADDHIRPNQLLLITLDVITEKPLAERILQSARKLLIPGAIRSLADQPVEFPLPLFHRDNLLANPHHPYRGSYGGDEDTSRKPAYHNGTAWTWLFPSYPEALIKVYGEPAHKSAATLLSSQIDLLTRGCLGHLPEIIDGDLPHTQRGCGAQAWSVTELYRVLHSLQALTQLPEKEKTARND